jgi:uncharacterized SAM-binding protein YcdF (DUF218 family)
MNSLFVSLGIESWKPFLTALVLPPIPLLLLVLIGARLLLRRRGLGWSLILLAVIGLWLSMCAGMADVLTNGVLRPPPALTPTKVMELRDRVKAREAVAIVVLGGGTESRAPEYGTSNIPALPLERLRFGIWLSRETGAPLGFSGGVGWAGPSYEGPPEAQIAARVAQRDFGKPLQWVESDSRDTRENAARTVALLKKDGIKEVVVVTHGWHMTRARRDFEIAAAGTMKITPAPMGLAPAVEEPILRWLPTAEGFMRTRQVVRELLGLLAGA